MRTKLMLGLGACGLLTTLAACTTSGSSIPAPTVTTTQTVTATPATSAPPASPLGMKVGAVYTVPKEGTTAAVLAYDDQTPGSGAESGNRLVALEVKVCATKTESVGNGAWSLIGADDSTSDIKITGGGLKEPQYQDGNTLVAGECARGWITFDIAKDQKVARAKYNPEDSKNRSLGVALWNLR